MAAKAKIDPRQAAVQRELASRLLAKRRLLPFIQRLNPKYQAGWVHEDICRRLERFSDDVAEGKSPRLMLLMPPRHGKLVADATPVMTPAGWVTHGELRVGDAVFSPDGTPTKVLAVAPADMASVEVETSTGARVKVHPDHEWTVYDRARAAWRTVETRYLLKQTLHSGPKGARGGRYRFQLPERQPLQFPETALPVSPYMLGLWLGDGKSADGSFCFAEADREVYRAAVGEGYVMSWSTTHSTTGVNYVGSSAFTRSLKALGVLNAKHIPPTFLRASTAQREQLLAGLIDSDGHVERRTGRVRVATCSARLRDDLFELIRSLGWEPYCFTQAPQTSTSGIVGRQDVYYVGFQPTRALPTRLPRKQILRFARKRREAIVAVRPAAPEKGRCIQVDREDGLYLVGRELTPTHNSEIASKNFPAWHLGRHPDHEFIACSYNISLAMGFSRKVKALLEDPAYQTVFDVRLDPNNQSTEEWGLAGNTGGYVAAGIGGGITGKGAHVLVIDDPIKNAEEAASAQVRESIWDWYGSTAYTRQAPGAGILIIQTWWHDDDLAGRIQTAMQDAAREGDLEDADMFEIVKYPAIAEADEYLDEESGEIVYDEAPAKGRLLRLKDEPLHPARYDLRKLMRIKRTIPPRFWSALYQQNPVPDDGSYFTKDQFRQAVLPPLGDTRVYIAWDFAISEKQHNDYTVGSVGLQDADDVLHVAEVVRFKSGDAFFIVEAILGLAQRWSHPSLVMGFEDGQIFRSLEALLKKRMRETRTYLSYEKLKPLTDKMVRARALQGRMQQGMVSFAKDAQWYDTVRTEMLRFPAGTNDDCVDSLGWMAQLAVGKEPPRKKEPRRMKSWKDKLMSSQAVSHMAA